MQLCILMLISIIFIFCSRTFFWNQQHAPFGGVIDSSLYLKSTDNLQTSKLDINIISSDVKPTATLVHPGLTFTLSAEVVEQNVAELLTSMKEEDTDSASSVIISSELELSYNLSSDTEVIVDDDVLVRFDGGNSIIDHGDSLDGDTNDQALSSDLTDDSADSDSDEGGTEDNPLCDRKQILDGKWIPVTLTKPPYITPTKHLRCYPRDTYYDKVNGWKSWKWYPTAKKEETCQFHTSFDKKEFCRLLENGVVSIVGDSLSWEHYSSLIQLNGLHTHQAYQHQSRELEMNIFQSVCNGKAKVLYRRDDKLQNLTSSLQQDFPVVLVLNRGAHYVPDEELLPGIRKNIAELNEHWIPLCLSRKIKCHLFWRTSVPGHPGCSIESGNKQRRSVFTQPNNDLQAMESLIGNLSMYDNHSMAYHWYDYQHQNELVLSELQTAFSDLARTSPYFHFEIIDAYYINVRRPDEHRAHQVCTFLFLFF